MKEEGVVKILKHFEQRDYKNGGFSIPPQMYFAISRRIIDFFSNKTTKSKLLNKIEGLQEFADKIHLHGSLNEEDSSYLNDEIEIIRKYISINLK